MIYQNLLLIILQNNFHEFIISSFLTINSCIINNFVSENFEKRKSTIKRNVYDLLGVKVDQVLQGHGTTNTGNVARRCFDQPDLFAEALEIDAELVRNIAMILLTFKSKNKIKLKELNEVCQQTYRLHYNKYPWARMNPTMHKLLIHGCQIAEQFPLPIAYFSEDANESWHKLYRENTISHSRQNSRENRILDVSGTIQSNQQNQNITNQNYNHNH